MAATIIASHDGSTASNPVPDWWLKEQLIEIGGRLFIRDHDLDRGGARRTVEIDEVSELPEWLDDAEIEAAIRVLDGGAPDAPAPATRVAVMSASDPGKLEHDVNNYLSAGGWAVHSFSTAYAGVTIRSNGPYSAPARVNGLEFSVLLVWDSDTQGEAE